MKGLKGGIQLFFTDKKIRAAGDVPNDIISIFTSASETAEKHFAATPLLV